MKRSISLISLGAIAALASGCNWSSRAEARDAGPAVDRTYQVAAFDRIESGGPYEVTVTTGGPPGVTARGGANLLDETEVTVTNGVLRIRPTKNKNFRWSWNDDSKVRMNVTTAGLRGAAIAGSGNMRIDRVTGGDFTGEVAGSGDLAIDRVDGGKVDLSVAGSGTVRAAGKAQSLDIGIAGSGDVDMSGLEAVAADVSIAGSGNVRARATGTANVSIMGSGDVAISGGAKCTVSKHGSGNVRCS